MNTYLVTGCGRGIGRALTEHLLARGDRVIGSVRSEEPPLQHEAFRTVTFDVRDSDAIATAASAVDEPIDVLVNNAGIPGEKCRPGYESDPSDFADVLDVNVLGPLRVTRAFLPHLGRSQSPKVVAISSQLGGMTHAVSSHLAYCTSKAALNKLMQGIAADLGPEAIPVLIVHPGWVRTDMGGASAPLDPMESATGIANLMDRLTMEMTGRFLNWDGSDREW